jgi:hypothetical protein
MTFLMDLVVKVPLSVGGLQTAEDEKDFYIK